MKTLKKGRAEDGPKVTVYIMNLSECPEIDSDVVGTLPGYRRDRIRLAGTKKVALTNYAAGLLMRDILGVRRDDDIITAEKGKPFLAEGKKYFSLSHDDKRVVLAVGSKELGADTESLREIKESVKKRVFREDELEYCGDDIAKSTWLWTRLEAALKLSGDGIGGIKDRPYSLLEDSPDLHFVSLKSDDSVISIACEDFFKTEVCEYRPQT